VRDAFGRLLAHPRTLSRDQRVALLADLAGELLAERALGRQWLGEALLAWLNGRVPIDVALEVRPPRGSRQTPNRIMAQRQAEAERRREAARFGTAEAARRLGCHPATVRRARVRASRAR
jgi:hypothetical protein